MPDLNRRQFLQAVATSTAGAVVFSACQAPASAGLEESRVLSAEDSVDAFENWYATTCRQCTAGCGLIVRVIEGRAKKAEGNPDHPINQGRLCARGQAAVQAEYHPDRIPGPRVRTAPRGSASFASLDWEAALDELAGRLRDLYQTGRGSQVVVMTPPLRGHHALLVDRFTTALGARWLTLDITGEAPLREAMRRVFGEDRLPDVDLQNADYILSFGADFLSTWLSPVRYSMQYGVFRQGSYRPSLQPRPRGHLVQIEPRFSTTAASADEWLPTRPGTEGHLALAIAQVLVSEGRGNAALGPGLARFQPEAVAPSTGIDADRIRRVAHEFGSSQRPVAIGGGSVGAQTNGSDVLAAVLGLNTLVDGSAFRFDPSPPIPGLPGGRASSSLAQWRALVEQLHAGQVDALLIFNTDPVYALPSALGFDAALRDTAALVVSFTGLLDDTAADADLVLPVHQMLEDWGDDVPEPGAGVATWSVQQPLLRPFHDTRSFWDILLLLASELGGEVARGLAWPMFKDVLRESARLVQAAGRGSVQDQDPERFWTKLLQHGGWRDDASSPTPPRRPDQLPIDLADPVFDGQDREYHLLPFVHNSVGDGRGAFLPWLQAAPDPLTSVVWQTWVELNPQRARELGLVEGDIVTLESAYGRIDVPVYIHPAAPPEVLGVPLGRGQVRSGRWAAGRGANPLDLVAPLTDAGSGALAYAATRVRLHKTGRHVGLPKMEGTVPAYQLPDEEVVKISA